jgi:hypothetical protein
MLTYDAIDKTQAQMPEMEGLAFFFVSRIYVTPYPACSEHESKADKAECERHVCHVRCVRQVRCRCVRQVQCRCGQMWAGGMLVSRVIHLAYLSNWNTYRGHIEGKGGGCGDPGSMHTGERASRDDSHT